jgi:hypothetical protein
MRSASTQGITLPRIMPNDIPSKGSVETKVLPRKRLSRYCPFFKGVLNMICWVLFAKSRMALALTKAVTMSRPSVPRPA